MKDLENLDNRSFLSILDVVREINDKLDEPDFKTWDDRITVKSVGHFIETDLMKFLPSDAIDSQAEYRKLRYIALEYLKDRDIIENYNEYNNEFFDRMSSSNCKLPAYIEICIHYEKFRKFYKETLKVYEKRITDSKKNKYSSKSEIKENDFRQTEREENQQASESFLSIQLGKQQLKINKNSGIVDLNKTKKNLNPGSYEFKILLKLATSRDYVATYKDLLGDNPTKINKRNLSFKIRNIKETLGILPKKKTSNQDIIKNMRNCGYRLIA